MQKISGARAGWFDSSEAIAAQFTFETCAYIWKVRQQRLLWWATCLLCLFAAVFYARRIGGNKI